MYLIHAMFCEAKPTNYECIKYTFLSCTKESRLSAPITNHGLEEAYNVDVQPNLRPSDRPLRCSLVILEKGHDSPRYTIHF